MEVVKFRGILTSLRKEIVYGVGFLKSPCAYDFLITENRKCETIKRRSLAQLIGYDSKGNEVYESDKIIDKNGNELTACFSRQGITTDGHRVDLQCDNFEFLLKDVELKEGNKK